MKPTQGSCRPDCPAQIERFGECLEKTHGGCPNSVPPFQDPGPGPFMFGNKTETWYEHHYIMPWYRECNKKYKRGQDKPLREWRRQVGEYPLPMIPCFCDPEVWMKTYDPGELFSGQLWCPDLLQCKVVDSKEVVAAVHHCDVKGHDHDSMADLRDTLFDWFAETFMPVQVKEEARFFSTKSRAIELFDYASKPVANYLCHNYYEESVAWTSHLIRHSTVNLDAARALWDQQIRQMEEKGITDIRPVNPYDKVAAVLLGEEDYNPDAEQNQLSSKTETSVGYKYKDLLDE